MKKGTKALLAIALASVICGLGLFAAAVAVAGGRFDAFQTRVYEEKSFSAQIDGLSLVSVRDDNHAIRFVRSDDSQIHVTYYESDREFYDIRTENGTLEIVYRNDRKWYEKLFNLNFQQISVTVALPDEYVGAIAADTSNSTVTVTGLDIDGDMNLKTDNGRIEIRDSSAMNISAVTSNGAVLLKGVETGAGIRAETSNGRMTAELVRCGTELTLTTSNGAVSLDSIFAGEAITLKSSNGSIAGSIDDWEGNYRITSKTSNGENHLPEDWGSGDKRLDVKTSNGTIDIEFLKSGD